MQQWILFMQRSFAHYAVFAQRRQRTVAAAAGFVLAGAGDLTAQSLAQGTSDSMKGGTASVDVDVRRVVAMAVQSGLFASLVYVPWLGLMARLFGEGTKRSVFLKVVAENIVLCPLVGLPWYYFVAGTLRGEEVKSIMQRIRCTYWSAYSGSVMVWLPGLIMNYGFVPPHLRSQTVYVLSYMQNTVVALTSNSCLVEE